MKRFLICILLLVLMVGLVGCMVGETSAVTGNISVVLNGNRLEFDQNPIMVDNRVLVPLRKIFEELGATVDFNTLYDEMSGLETIVINARTENMQLLMNRTYFDYKGGLAWKYWIYAFGYDWAIQLGQGYLTEDNGYVPPIILNDRTLVPVRFVSETLGANVDWDNDTQTVIIDHIWSMIRVEEVTDELLNNSDMIFEFVEEGRMQAAIISNMTLRDFSWISVDFTSGFGSHKQDVLYSLDELPAGVPFIVTSSQLYGAMTMRGISFTDSFGRRRAYGIGADMSDSEDRFFVQPINTEPPTVKERLAGFWGLPGPGAWPTFFTDGTVRIVWNEAGVGSLSGTYTVNAQGNDMYLITLEIVGIENFTYKFNYVADELFYFWEVPNIYEFQIFRDGNPPDWWFQ